eukprot:scaffold308354_cov18-Tisochrysis_lutea.AAC.1
MEHILSTTRGYIAVPAFEGNLAEHCCRCRTFVPNLVHIGPERTLVPNLVQEESHRPTCWVMPNTPAERVEAAVQPAAACSVLPAPSPL